MALKSRFLMPLMIGFTFIGLTARLFGKSFLEMKMDESRDSYWVNRTPEPFDKERYEKIRTSLGLRK